MLDAFCEETKPILVQAAAVLEQLEESPVERAHLVEFGRLIDGVMGSAKVIAVDFPAEHLIQKIGLFSELCRVIARRGSEIDCTPDLLKIVASILFEATEVLGEYTDAIKANAADPVDPGLSDTFLKRLNLLSQKFDQYRKADKTVTKKTAEMGQNDIDALLKQLQGG